MREAVGKGIALENDRAVVHDRLGFARSVGGFERRYVLIKGVRLRQQAGALRVMFRPQLSQPGSALALQVIALGLLRSKVSGGVSDRRGVARVGAGHELGQKRKRRR